MPPEENKSETFPVKSTDEEMRAAMRRAREAFPEFVREVEADSRRIIPALQSALVKAYFVDEENPSEGEHMWVDEVEWDSALIRGRLVSSPSHVRSVKMGDQVSFPLERLSDWLYVLNDKAHGAYTVQVLRNRMSKEERATHDSNYPFSFE